MQQQQSGEKEKERDKEGQQGGPGHNNNHRHTPQDLPLAQSEQELSKLPTKDLLRHLRRAAAAKEEENLRPFKQRLLSVLLSRDLSDFSNEELFDFMALCPSQANNGKALKHAEQLLHSRAHAAQMMGKKELWRLLGWALNSSQLPDKEQNLVRLVELLLHGKRWEELSHEEMVQLLNVASLEQRNKLLTHLYQQRERLTSLQLFQVLKFFFSGPPNEQIQNLLNTMYSHEQQRVTTEKEKLFAFLMPVGGGTMHMNAGFAAGREQPDVNNGLRHTSFLQQHATKSHVYFLDCTFNPVFEQQIARDGVPALANYAVQLWRQLPEGQGAAIFLSLPPYSQKHLVGCLMDNHPLLPLPYPLPVVGAVTAVRVIAQLVPLEKLNKHSDQLGKLMGSASSAFLHYKDKATTSERGEMLTSSPIIGATERKEGKLSGEVVVCYGELHPFKLSEDDTFEELLRRATIRWNVAVSYSNYELQDENFKTLPPQEKVIPYMLSDTNDSHIIRLTPKGPFTATPAFSPFQPPSTRQQPAATPSPFRPFGHQSGSLY
ncbi:hypothetical protein QOT17_003980 [Balamuthia mandrillaris]